MKSRSNSKGNAGSQLSKKAFVAMMKGAMAMCPGCKIDQQVPDNFNGVPIHRMSPRSVYTCHAQDAWHDVPEFTAKAAAGEL